MAQPRTARSKHAMLELRGRTLRALREGFHARGYLEVETPVRVPVPALETHIDAVRADGAYLRTSPELYMKRLLAQGEQRLFELGPCFRAGERGTRHNPEYTLLEWYRAGCGYRDMLDETEAMLVEVAARVRGEAALMWDGRRVELEPRPWRRLDVSEAFRLHAGWDPALAFDEDRFDLDLVERVEPALPRDRPVFLLDFPAPRAALARLSAERPEVAERWELYIGGMELANAYGELTDAAEQRRRFEQARAERAGRGREAYALDEAFLAALEAGMPACTGVALGVDRLVMLLADAANIGEVRAFLD